MNRTLDSATLLDDKVAFDATVDSAVAVGVAPAPSSRSTARSTVLPRVERTEQGALLVSASRPRFEHKRSLGQGGIGEVVAAVDQDIG
ncbi:MAG: hypothetical protein ACRELB_10990, partial [Polyangiaceae bacterium]